MASSPRVPRRGVGLASALALGICAPLGLSHGALRQPGAKTLLSNVYTDAKGETMNSPWRFAAPPANSTNPNQACKLWVSRPYPVLEGDGVQCNQLGCGVYACAPHGGREESRTKDCPSVYEVRFSSSNP